MNKILIPIALIAFSFSSAFAQENIEDLCNSWQAMRFMDQAAGEAWSATDEEKEQWVTFQCDGTYEEILASGETVQGKWDYDAGSGIIKVSQDSRKDYPAEIKFTLIELQHNYLVVDMEDEDGRKLRVFSTAVEE